jgi:hypothetical protein
MLCVGVSEGWYNDNSVLVGASIVEHVLEHTTGNYMAISMVTVCCMSSNIEIGPTIPTYTLCAGYYVY